VQAGEVFVTSAGAPASELARINKARYIFHVAAVEAVDAEGIVIPFKQPYQIEGCVRASLAKLVEVNQLQGIISPPETEQRKQQEARAGEGRGIARSIIFPLFGTGQGGGVAGDVIGPMLDGIYGFFDDPESAELAATLNEIYISAFKQDDVEAVAGFLRSRKA
jgi:hypothetical protein